MPRVTLSAAQVGLFSFDANYTKLTPHYEFDLSQFRDPIHKFRSKRGRDPEVKEWIKSDARFLTVLSMVKILVSDAIDKQQQNWISISFRDYHGRWKSEAVAELV